MRPVLTDNNKGMSSVQHSASSWIARIWGPCSPRMAASSYDAWILRFAVAPFPNSLVPSGQLFCRQRHALELRWSRDCMGLSAWRGNSGDAFNLPIGVRDVSSVTDMSGCSTRTFAAFNQPIRDWDVSAVINIPGCSTRTIQAFNQPIGRWDSSSITDMS